MLKEKNDWLKISFTAVNSGRMNIDMRQKGTEHWVVFNFDRSIYKAKLGGLRQNIKRQLAKEGFRLDAGKTVKNYELKISAIMPTPLPKKAEPKPLASKPANRTKPKNKTALSSPASWQNTQMPSLPKQTLPQKSAEKKPCPDILFTDVTILKQDDKWATVRYTITNQGEGVFYLYGQSDSRNDNLVINAYISGVTALTRGAIPIGGQILPEKKGVPNVFKTGDKLTGTLKLDIRKKTRYMKSLVLSLDSNQFVQECDRKNNHTGVVLK
ncbi:MAG TPA: hypothetical protein ENJ95_15425 [Bacteroidetes bacterium]|nr:hypothetical protein [Bacteroidota bacterium]